ncbi:MAG: Dabb family protein [Candidatus Thiodiazotropha sp. (ex Epidulcina cf. delphinae)]|nr:Dabb family protein [Candidatus Thiodiazotropha sp. (ex Epidulcina cf. delphinae)]
MSGFYWLYCRLVRFSDEAVIDSYREHQDHLAFADRLFRPIARDRISIDYESVEMGNSPIIHSEQAHLDRLTFRRGLRLQSPPHGGTGAVGVTAR